MDWRRAYVPFRCAVVVLATAVLLSGCDDDDNSPPLSPTPTIGATTSTPTRSAIPASPTPTEPATRTVTSAVVTETPTAPVATTTSTATGTATPTTPTGSSYVGDYNGTAGNYATRFHVNADGSAVGFLDFLTGGAATGRGPGAADVSASYDASGQANRDTGAYQLTGSFFGNSFTIAGQLPASPDATGTLSITVFDETSTGTLHAGTVTPTPTPGCDSADLQASLATLSGDFNGTGSNFVVDKMNVAVEQKAPDFISGLHEVYDSTFNGTNCEATRNIQISLYESPGGLAAGQTFVVGGTSGLVANVYYGQQVGGDDSAWSSSAGTVVIDAVEGSVVTLRVVDAAMTVPAGNAAGSFTLNVSGQVKNFTRQVD